MQEFLLLIGDKCYLDALALPSLGCIDGNALVRKVVVWDGSNYFGAKKGVDLDQAREPQHKQASNEEYLLIRYDTGRLP